MSFYENKNVLVTGGNGFLGTHLIDKLIHLGAHNVWFPSHADVDLRDFDGLCSYMIDSAIDPDIIFHLAAHVGGIAYNQNNPATLIHDNTVMALNMIRIAKCYNAKMVAAGSVCAYPAFAPVPTIEENLYNGYPEESNGAYGNAKRMLLELQRAYYKQYDLPGAHLVSANLYGPGDNFDPASSHIIPALIYKIQNAIDGGFDNVTVWGTGKVSRDFLYVEDAADAYLVAGEHIDVPEPINIASGQESPVHFIVTKLMQIMGCDAELIYDTDRPEGQKRRAFHTHKMKEETGWSASTPLDVGLEKTVEWYRSTR